MSENRFDTVKQYGRTVGRGLLLEFAPRITAGIISDLFREWGVTVDKLAEDVETDNSLLDRITDDQLNQLQTGLNNVDFFEFLTADFVADSIEKDFPAVAIMIRTWPEAKAWMEKQLDDLRSLFSH